MDKGVDVEAGLLEELSEHWELTEEGNDGDENHEGGVDDALRDDGAEALGEGDTAVLLEGAATGDFADAGYDEASGVAEEDGIGAEACGGVFTHRLEGHAPTECAEGEGHNAEGETEEHPSPMDVVGNAT